MNFFCINFGRLKGGVDFSYGQNMNFFNFFFSENFGDKFLDEKKGENNTRPPLNDEIAKFCVASIAIIISKIHNVIRCRYGQNNQLKIDHITFSCS